jgi:outer membrane protein OmpA-like peptidoglycan-associated protein
MSCVFNGGMRLVRCTCMALAAVLLSACSWLWPGPEPVREPVQYISLPVSAAKTAHDQITILPKEDGSIGGVVVRQEGIEVLLDKPYATALVEGPGLVTESTYDKQLAKQDFAGVLEALPERATHFRVYFMEGNDELTPESEEEVGRIFAELSSRPDPEIVLVGHTDAVGAGQYNDQLSLERAERVRDELIRLGIPDANIVVEGRGKREPLVPTEDGVAEPQNRRVEIDVR